MARAPEEGVVPTGRHGLPPDVVAAHQRERLFDATVELVAKRGYLNTSIDQIVKAARVGYVAFYELYDGKEECVLAAFDRVVAEATEAAAAAAAAEEEWPEQMAAGLGSLLELAVAEPQRARIALVEVQSVGPRGYARYEQTLEAAVPKLREGRALNPAAAELSETLEEAVLGGIVWIVQQSLVKGELKKADSLLGEAIQIALSPYVGESQAKKLAARRTRARA